MKKGQGSAIKKVYSDFQARFLILSDIDCKFLGLAFLLNSVVSPKWIFTCECKQCTDPSYICISSPSIHQYKVYLINFCECLVDLNQSTGKLKLTKGWGACSASNCGGKIVNYFINYSIVQNNVIFSTKRGFQCLVEGPHPEKESVPGRRKKCVNLRLIKSLKIGTSEIIGNLLSLECRQRV